MQHIMVRTETLEYKIFTSRTFPATARDEDGFTPGDIMIHDGTKPNTLWVYYGPGDWREWVSMKKTLECPHPTQDLIIVPTISKFAWVDKTGYAHHLEAVTDRMGKCTDCADIHIAIMQNTPTGPGEQLAIDTASRTETWADENSDNNPDAEGVSDDDHLGSTYCMSGHSNTVDSGQEAQLSVVHLEKNRRIEYKARSNEDGKLQHQSCHFLST